MGLELVGECPTAKLTHMAKLVSYDHRVYLLELVIEVLRGNLGMPWLLDNLRISLHPSGRQHRNLLPQSLRETS